MKITITGDKEINSKLSLLDDVNWNDIGSEEAEKLKQISDSVTPYRTGALRNSATYENGEFGYTADYAAHVNYGHRTRGGGFVPGKHFLEEVVNGQEQDYKDEVLKSLKESIR